MIGFYQTGKAANKLVKIKKGIRDHWQGKTEFAWLLAVNLFCVQLTFHVFGRAIQHAPDAIWIVLFGFIGLVFIWQVVGAYRHVERALMRAEGVYVAIGVFFAFILILISNSWLVGDKYRQITAPVQEAFVDPNLIPLPVSSDGTQVFITGAITLSMYSSLVAMTEFNDLRQVVLNSEGGNVFAARGLLRLFEERRLDTYVSEKCFSACTIAFLGGKKRTASADAVFGYHGYRFTLKGSGFELDIEEQQDKDRKLFSDRGVDDAFIDRIFQTSSDDLWRPNHEELRAVNILN